MDIAKAHDIFKSDTRIAGHEFMLHHGDFQGRNSREMLIKLVLNRLWTGTIVQIQENILQNVNPLVCHASPPITS